MVNLDLLYKRKSVRNYKEGIVPREDIIKLLDVATQAPSPKNQQNWHFVVVQNKDVINKIVEVVSKSHEYIASLIKDEKKATNYMNLLPYYVNFKDASCVILVYAKEYFMIEEKILRENNVSEDVIKVIKSPEAGAQGIGAAVQNILLAATEMGYGTCYLTGPSHAKTEIEEIIAFEKPEYTLMSLVSLGIPADETPEKPRRKPLEEVITFIE